MLADILQSERSAGSLDYGCWWSILAIPRLTGYRKIKSHLETTLKISLHRKRRWFCHDARRNAYCCTGKTGERQDSLEFHDRIVEFEDLPERLTDEFTMITAGLVSNVVLASFASIRRNTSKVLRRFSPRLDPAFLAHRFMLQEPSEAEEHLVTLISEELHGILEEERVGTKADIKAIEARLASVNFSGLTLRGKNAISQYSRCFEGRHRK